MLVFVSISFAASEKIINELVQHSRSQSKGQVFSEGNFGVFISPKKRTIFKKIIPALASKTWSNKKDKCTLLS